MRKGMGSSHGAKGSREDFACDACGGSWSMMQEREGAEWCCHGDQWCFHGEHTLQALDKRDACVIKPNSVDLVGGPELQAEIDALPSDSRVIKRLTVHKSGTYMDTKSHVSFTAGLARLKVLHIIDVCVATLHLTSTSVPALTELFVQNIGPLEADCDLSIVLPKLQDAKIFYLDVEDDAPIRDMLAAATTLVRFHSYKLRGADELEFASNSLESVVVHRTDCLSTLSVWSPVLKELTVQGCFGGFSDGAEVSILDEHPLKMSMPGGAGSALSTGIEVSVLNSRLEARSLSRLCENPRVSQVKGLDDDDGAHDGTHMW
jgi:hypothetical protein